MLVKEKITYCLSLSGSYYVQKLLFNICIAMMSKSPNSNQVKIHCSGDYLSI